MSKAIETLRQHFNQKPVPNSNVLMEERDRVNAMIDTVEAENAELREQADFEHFQLEEMKRAAGMMLDEFDALANDNARLVADNGELLGIVRDLHKALFTLDIDHCQACPRDNINGPCTKFAVWGNDECSIEEDMRKLGIDVGE